MRKVVLSVVMAAALSMGVASHAHAGSLANASGTFTLPVDNLTPLFTAGNTTYFNEVATIVYSGPLSGTATDHDIFVLHSDGSFYTSGTETCPSCTLGGKTGSFSAVFYFSGTGFIGDFSQLEYSGVLKFTNGGGMLTGLYGGGPFSGDATSNHYSYNYGFRH